MQEVKSGSNNSVYFFESKLRCSTSLTTSLTTFVQAFPAVLRAQRAQRVIAKEHSVSLQTITPRPVSQALASESLTTADGWMKSDGSICGYTSQRTADVVALHSVIE